MCKDYEFNLEIERFLLEVNALEDWPQAALSGLPHHFSPEEHVRITDKGLLVQLKDDRLRVELLPWAWEDRDQYLFNLCAESRSFANSIRCLIAATGFYLHTKPTGPGQRQGRQLFHLKGHEWFWIAGIVRHGAFAMLTRMSEAMPSIRRRQICILPPHAGLDWLKSAEAAPGFLTPLPLSAFDISTLDRDLDQRPAASSRIAAGPAHMSMR